MQSPAKPPRHFRTTAGPAAAGRCTLLQRRASSAGLELRCPSVSHRLTFKACHFTGRPAASNPTWQLSSSMTPGNLFSQAHSRHRHYRSIKVISRRPDKMSGWISSKNWKVLMCYLEAEFRTASEECLCGAVVLRRWSNKRRTWRIKSFNSCWGNLHSSRKSIKNKRIQ